jgi:excisionase family DNA binding protein
MSVQQPLTIQEVAEFFRVGEDKIREWMAFEDDALPSFRSGHRTLRFDKEAVEAWWKRRSGAQGVAR